MATGVIKIAASGLILSFLTASFCEAIVNSKIDRIIDLSSQLVKIVDKISIEQPEDVYKLVIPDSHRQRLAYLDVKINDKSLKITENPIGQYQVSLAGHDTKSPLVVTSVYTKLLQPYPAEITQSETQLVRFEGFQHTVSPYLTKTSSTRIKLPISSRLESFTKASKMTTGTNKLTYGPSKDIQPNQAEELMIHYENNSPFVAVTQLNRIIDISPWTGKINLANEVKIAHVGAKLKGPFSRFEYQRDHSNGISSVRSLSSELPKSASSIYFRDAIGNISTSSIRFAPTKVAVNIKPRFPLFGGWVTDFVLGYQVPLQNFLSEPKSGSERYLLSIPLADILYDSMFIEDATVRIYLPAGACEHKVESGLEFERLPDEFNYSYLDVLGRPVIILKKSNVVAQHLEGKMLNIRFRYNKMYQAQEPAILAFVALVTFILAVIYSKLTTNSGSQASKTKTD